MMFPGRTYNSILPRLEDDSADNTAPACAKLPLSTRQYLVCLLFDSTTLLQCS